MDDIQKKYPKAGLKWESKEDELLKKTYSDFQSKEGRDFDSFLAELITQFGRAAGGLKARLAKYFDDVPGWDYERDKQRAEYKAEEIKRQASPEIDEIILREYQKYLDSKQETFKKFILRVSHLVNKPRSFLRPRLFQLVSNVIEYREDDLGRGYVNNRFVSQKEQECVNFDFSQNPEAQTTLRLMEDTCDNLFLTGEAGTGKSSLLKYFRHITKKKVIVLAPTGVAALNVDGQTIHSFCGFKPDITIDKVKKLGEWFSKKQLLVQLQTMIIDEISMVRADLLDCLDKFLRLNGPILNAPFGGIQMIFIGDLYQLPPVDKDFNAISRANASGQTAMKYAGNSGTFINSSHPNHSYSSPYFFDSQAFKQAKFHYIQLKQIYRQQDGVFIDLLNAVRNNAVTQEHLTILNNRSQADIDFTFEQFTIYLTPTNQRARQVNDYFLGKLAVPFKTYKGIARGSFVDHETPTDMNLQIKIGAQVMMLNNDREKRWVNGTMGRIAKIESGEATNFDDDEIDFDSIFGKAAASVDAIIVELESGETVNVLPHTWEMFKFVLDKHTQKIDSQVVGAFTQYPFKLAWAVTIHKAQGKTFDKVYIDLSTGTFAHGQLYVALSRCRTLDGLYLKRPITPADILLDDRVVKFLSGLRMDSQLRQS